MASRMGGGFVFEQAFCLRRRRGLTATAVFGDFLRGALSGDDPIAAPYLNLARVVVAPVFLQGILGEKRDGLLAHFFLIFFRKSGRMATSTAQIAELIESTVTGLGFEFVDYEKLPHGLLRVTIDSTKEGGITVDDCEMVSDQITHLFTVEGVEYERLEVSSPGVDRPLKRARDWQRFLGRPVQVELYEPMKAEGFPEAGRRKLQGRALAVEGEGPETRIRFSFEELHIARTPSEAVRGKKTGKKAAEAAPVVVTFDLADVDRANLIAELDFRGKK